MRVVVTGGWGFIGSHLVDALVKRGDEVTVLDYLAPTGDAPAAPRWVDVDLRSEPIPLDGADVVFHLAAIGRTPHAVANPVLCWETNLMLSVKVLEAARQARVPRVVLSSSNIVYAAETPYKASKLAMEDAAKVYSELYGLSTICLRYANTYGERQSEEGIGPNVFASLRKSLREKGYVEITGDGEQSRDFIHVSDVVEANLLAAESEATGELDICTGINTSMNEIAELIDAEVRYTPEREGDIKHIVQAPEPAKHKLRFIAKTPLELGIWDSFPDAKVPA